MPTAARKARKRAGIKFVHPTKVGTPYMERVIPMVYNDALSGPSARARKKLKGYADITAPPEPKPKRKSRATLNPRAK